MVGARGWLGQQGICGPAKLRFGHPAAHTPEMTPGYLMRYHLLFLDLDHTLVGKTDIVAPRPPAALRLPIPSFDGYRLFCTAARVFSRPVRATVSGSCR